MIVLFENKKDCCGCSACANICPQKAIKMVEDEEGFLYPQIDEEKCINCGICKKICAFQKGTEVKDRLENPLVLASKASDEIRMKSTSGGMFTLISDEILENNGLVYGVAFDEKLHAHHIRAEKKEERDLCRGSKYSQSDLKDTFEKIKKDLKDGRRVLFTGTPCQVGALNEFLHNENTDNLLLVDLVCHGTPSPKMFQDYISMLEKINKSKIKEYYHRPKGSKFTNNEKAIYENGKVDDYSRLTEVWKIIFLKDLALRPSCYECKYTNINRKSDITIGDFWGIEKTSPEFLDNKGISLIILNTKKGESIFNKIKDKMEFIEKNSEEAVAGNPQLKEPIKRSEEREIFWKEYNEKGFCYIAKKYGGYTLKNRVKRNIKKTLKKVLKK